MTLPHFLTSAHLNPNSLFIGYEGDEYGHRFQDHDDRKVVRSRDVIFNEDVMYKDRKVETQSPSLFPEVTTDFDWEVSTEVDLEAHAESEDDAQQGALQEEILDHISLPIALRKTPRIVRKPSHFLSIMNYLLLTNSGEPKSF